MSDNNPGSGFFSMGLKTHSVPMEMFAENRRRLCQRLRGAEGVTEGAVILLQGGGDQVTCHGWGRKRTDTHFVTGTLRGRQQ